MIRSGRFVVDSLYKKETGLGLTVCADYGGVRNRASVCNFIRGRTPKEYERNHRNRIHCSVFKGITLVYEYIHILGNVSAVKQIF